jgi:ubiquinone/menaquinone biosynthesis C-methylase UbiE
MISGYPLPTGNSEEPLFVSGWMLNPEIEFDSFAIYIDKHNEGLSKIIIRDDVAKVFPDIPHAKNTGFSFGIKVPPQNMDRMRDICIVGLLKGKEITKIGTYYCQILDELVPPEKLILSVGGGFESVGNEFLRYFIDLCELKTNEKVLDVGCGVGRMAVPLMNYLNECGGYEGFDIIGDAINWCKKNITRKHPNFKFQQADIYNKAYNSVGSLNASKYTFPFNDESFDFVFLTSVFTHMMPQDVENYLSEVGRVLKDSGRCLITFFLLNNMSIDLVSAKKSSLDFKYNHGKYSVVDEYVPESAVAYDELYVRGLYIKHGLTILDPIYYGYWCNRKQFLSYQDIIIAKK